MESDNSPFQITLVLTKHLYTELMLTQQLPEWLGQPTKVSADCLIWEEHPNQWGGVDKWGYVILRQAVLKKLTDQFPIRSWVLIQRPDGQVEYGNGSLAP